MTRPFPGFGHVHQFLSLDEVAVLQDRLPDLEGKAGSRQLLADPWFLDFALASHMVSLAESIIGPGARPVRGILFDKTPGQNWNLGWHQDTKIAVQNRVEELEGFGGWSQKEGIWHVQPPVEILEKMVALRLHLDPSDASTGGLWLIPNSHLAGIRTEPDAPELGRKICPSCAAGDLHWMQPLVFHASFRSEIPRHRRVVHLEYCSAELPPPLSFAWSPAPSQRE